MKIASRSALAALVFGLAVTQIGAAAVGDECEDAAAHRKCAHERRLNDA